MGVLGYIAKRKAQFQDYTVEKRKEMILKKTAKVQAENIRRATVVEAKQELQEAQTIKQDLKQAQGPSNLRKLGRGMAKHIEKTKAGVAKAKSQGFLKGPFTAPPSSGSKGMQMGRGPSFGGGSPGGFTFGPTPKAKPEKKKGTTIIIKT